MPVIVASPAVALCSILSSSGWDGITPTPALFVDWHPADDSGPDRVVALDEIGAVGGANAFTCLGSFGARLQVRARAEPRAYVAAQTIAWRAWQTIAAIGQRTVTGASMAAIFTGYRAGDLADMALLNVSAPAPPVLVDRDHRDRCTFRFDVEVEVSTAVATVG